MPVSISGTNGVTFPDGSLQAAAASPFGLKNRLINADMRIDQRNAGASTTPTSTTANIYSLDRWLTFGSQASKFSIQQNAGSVTPPTGFTNYLGITSLSAYTVGSSELFLLEQYIEGFNIADFDWGTANAKTVTLSFWVRSSLTGTFGGSLRNSADNRCYPFSYTISSANTWEQKTITIVGDTSGTWITNSGRGIKLCFSLGSGSTYSGTAGAWTGSTITAPTGATSVVGTNGATFYITGVQLEIGTSATPFERRMYGQELSLCQRYYYRTTQGGANAWGPGYNLNTTSSEIVVNFPVTMRASPTGLETDGVASNYAIQYLLTATACNAVPTFANANQNSARVAFTVASGLTAGQGSLGRAASAGAYLGWSAEL
jgi:hypothetical protein